MEHEIEFISDRFDAASLIGTINADQVGDAPPKSLVMMSAWPGTLAMRSVWPVMTADGDFSVLLVVKSVDTSAMKLEVTNWGIPDAAVLKPPFRKSIDEVEFNGTADFLDTAKEIVQTSLQLMGLSAGFDSITNGLKQDDPAYAPMGFTLGQWACAGADGAHPRDMKPSWWTDLSKNERLYWERAGQANADVVCRAKDARRESNKKYGWFSAQSKNRGNSTSFYRTPSGDEVEISAHFSTNDPEEVRYGFADKVCVGEITCYLRTGQAGVVIRSALNTLLSKAEDVCPDCKGTRQYVPLTGPPEPCKTCFTG